MHAIAELICGVVGAAGGQVELYVRGTSTRATWYSDFEGTQANASGANITLDGNGGAEVYVNQLVTVVVKNTSGVTVREFVAGSAAPAVELRSLSATGTDYISGQLAAGNPTTTQAWADSWRVSAGAADFKVDVGDGNGAQTLIFLLGLLSGLFFNVKAYGAVGDGTTDDQAAIQDALDAAAIAGNGGSQGAVVFFPPGTYRITGEISATEHVSLVGCGANSSVITIDHASNDLLDWNLHSGTPSPTYVIGLAFTQEQDNSGVLQRFDGSSSNAWIVFSACLFGCSASSTGPMLRSSASGSRDLFFSHCDFLPGAQTAVVSQTTATNKWRFSNCKVKTPASYNLGSIGMFTAGRMQLTNCVIDCLTTTAGADFPIIKITTGVTPFITVTGCYISATGGGITNTFIDGTDDVSSGDSIIETGNAVHCNTLYALTFDGTESGLRLESRLGRRTATTLSGGSHTCDFLNYEIHELTRSTDTPTTITPTFCPIGSTAIVIYTTTGTASTGAVLTFDYLGGGAGGRGTLSDYTPPSAADVFQVARATQVRTGSTRYWAYEPVFLDQLV